MSWNSVSSHLKFDVAQWNIQPGSVAVRALDDPDQVISAIKNLYDNSPTAHNMLESLTSGRYIRIGIGSIADACQYSWADSAHDDYFLINKAAVDDTLYMSTKGVVVRDNFELAIAHELAHKFYTPAGGPPSLDPSYTTLITQPAFDFDGKQVRAENAVADELGLSNNERSSYLAAYRAGQVEASTLAVGDSYTDNKHIDVTILGHDGPADRIDISSLTTHPTALLVGLGGVIK